MNIRVLGAGCANCKKVEALVNDVVTELGVAADVEKVTDYQEMMKYGIMATPGLVIEGEVRSTGRIPAKVEVVQWVITALSRGASQ